ncbi:hypothetical protein C0993_009394 [Termitomyces sp. T159_Od127]|nr:hypothetical protein C0993_009394 [Termitomyces sp. T159_Od127]
MIFNTVKNAWSKRRNVYGGFVSDGMSPLPSYASKSFYVNVTTSSTHLRSLAGILSYVGGISSPSSSSCTSSTTLPPSLCTIGAARLPPATILLVPAPSAISGFISDIPPLGPPPNASRSFAMALALLAVPEPEFDTDDAPWLDTLAARCAPAAPSAAVAG